MMIDAQALLVASWKYCCSLCCYESRLLLCYCLLVCPLPYFFICACVSVPELMNANKNGSWQQRVLEDFFRTEGPWSTSIDF